MQDIGLPQVACVNLKKNNNNPQLWFLGRNNTKITWEAN